MGDECQQAMVKPGTPQEKRFLSSFPFYFVLATSLLGMPTSWEVLAHRFVTYASIIHRHTQSFTNVLGGSPSSQDGISQLTIVYNLYVLLFQIFTYFW